MYGLVNCIFPLRFGDVVDLERALLFRGERFRFIRFSRCLFLLKAFVLALCAGVLCWVWRRWSEVEGTELYLFAEDCACGFGQVGFLEQGFCDVGGWLGSHVGLDVHMVVLFMGIVLEEWK